MTGDLWHDDPVNRPTPVKFDWANKVVLPIIGAGIFAALLYYGILPWDAVKEILFHDL
jgi:hypothetical protein